MSSGTRRPRIRPPRQKLTQDVNFDAAWATLSQAMGEIYKKNGSQLSYQVLYTNVYTLVSKGRHGKRLHEAVESQIRHHIDARCKLISSLPGKTGVDLLKIIKQEWDDHCLCMVMFCEIFVYLDKVFSKEEQVPLLSDVGLAAFKDALVKVTSGPTIGHAMCLVILDLLTNDRQKAQKDLDIIKPIVRMLESLPESYSDGKSMYNILLEPKLIESAQDYYTNVANKYLESSHDAHAYMQACLHWLDGEAVRCSELFPLSTWTDLVKRLETCLIHDKFESVLTSSSGIFAWIDTNAYEPLSLCYKLLSRQSDPHGMLKTLTTRYIRENCDIINTKSKENLSLAVSKGKRSKSNRKEGDISPSSVSREWVQEMLCLRQKFNLILQNSFQDDTSLKQDIARALALEINENPKAAEFLSLCIDECLKKSSNNSSSRGESDLEQTLDDVLVLFRYLADKDLFETYYRNHLAKRLLNNRSLSPDAELGMIGRLNQELGTAFTCKLQGMFRDMENSKDLVTEFQNSPFGTRAPLSLMISVLTPTFWPSYTASANINCNLPAQVVKASQEFEAFYTKRHQGRRLKWNVVLGVANVKCRFGDRTYDVSMPTLAMVVFMLFENLSGASLSLEEIQEKTDLPLNELTRQLQAISVAPRTRLLCKTPMSKDINPGDMFSVNETFESKSKIVKVLAISGGTRVESEDERKTTQDKLDLSRKHETDAAIVRIMKTRKTLDHSNLVAEVTRQLTNRFKPDLAMIKQRIDALLEQEYIERHADKRNVYNYHA